MLEILPRLLNMDCKWPKLAFCTEIPFFILLRGDLNIGGWEKQMKIDMLVPQFYGCFALQVFEPVT